MMGKYEIVKHATDYDFEFGSTHNAWLVDLNGSRYYVSHQDNLPFVGPECMAFRSDRSSTTFEASNWGELAVSHAEDPLEAFAEVMEQLEARYAD